MTRVLKGLWFAGLGGAIACVVTFVVVFSYSYETPTPGLIILAVSIGSLLGFVAGALWGNGANKGLPTTLINPCPLGPTAPLQPPPRRHPRPAAALPRPPPRG